MAQLRQDYQEFVARGAEVVVVGPEDGPAFQAYWQKEQLPFVGLPDPKHTVADLYGQQVKLLKMGRMPALMVVDKEGQVRYQHYGNSMRDIPPNDEILALLDDLNRWNGRDEGGVAEMKLDGQVALVTGGAVRLGKALALALAGEGVRVAVHYASSVGPAGETVAQIKAAGSDALAIQADLFQSGQAASVIERAVAYFGQVDILINSAAIFEPADVAHTTEDLWDRHFAINLKAPFFLSQAFAAQVGKDRSGHIVNIADWRGLRPDTRYLAYSLTKAGLLVMTQGLALAVAPNIQVNALALGAILPPPGRDQTYLDGLAQGIPLRRVGSPEEVAKALRYLLQSDFITGEVIFVTGGEHL